MNAEQLPAFAERYLDCFAETWTDETPIEQVRFVVLDTETTGLDPRRDKLITIGAVAVLARRDRSRRFIRSDDEDCLQQLFGDRARYHA